MNTWGRLRLLALASVLAVVLSMQVQGSTAAQIATLEPPQASLAQQPSVREIARSAQADAERLTNAYTILVYGVEAGYGFAVGDHYYLPARRFFTTLGGSVRPSPSRNLQVEVPGHATVTVPMYSFLDRGYVRLEEVRELLPGVQVDRESARIVVGAARELPALPPTDGGLQAVFLDDQVFSTRGLQVGGQVYVPLATGAQSLAATSRYDAAAGLGFLNGDRIETFFAPLPGVAGVPYVRLDDLLRRLNVDASVRLKPAERVDSLSFEQPGLTATAETLAPLPENSVIYGATDSSKRIALTFDDYLGPWIPNLLQTLGSLDVRATFFTIGASVRAHPELAQSIVDAGHQIAGHTFNHYDGFTMTLDEVRAELAGTRRAIRDATGVDSHYWRPPGGYVNTAMVDQAALPLGLATVLWSVNSDDANPRMTADDVYQQVMKEAFPGAIVAMHMGSTATLQALPRIVGELRAQGYSFVTVEQLLQTPPVAEGD